jgi:diaminopimelate epimerase
MGNPHAVLRVDDLDAAPVKELGAFIETHPRFPKRANVGFMQVLAPDHIRLRVFERAAGETLACGTGACAAVVAGRLHGWLTDHVRVDLPGGQLNIQWAGEGHPVMMTGPVSRVFTGHIDL